MGQGRALDPEQYCIIATDALGNGWSSSPSNSPEQPGTEFPRFTLKDMVASQYRLQEVLGIKELFCVIGASMGGMQALQWGIDYPTFMDGLIVIAATSKLSPQAIGFNKVGRRLPIFKGEVVCGIG